MKTSETIELLAPDYVAAQAELKNATFDKENPHFKSRYATLASVRDTVAPVLAKHGLAVIQGVDLDEGACIVVTRLLHKSGQWIESLYPLALDKPQVMGSSLTYARRYCLSAICGIASEEDDDGNEGQKGDAKPEVKKAFDRSPIVKAKFAELTTGIRERSQHGTLEDLAEYWKSNQSAIVAMPADWKAILEEEKEAAKSKLKEAA